MIWRKTMNNELNKNEASRGPLIFTLPATRFLVALNVDRLEGTDWGKNRGRGVERKAGSFKGVSKEVIGLHLLLTRSLFGGGILHRLLPHVSLAKSTSAPLQCSWLSRTQPQFG